MRQLLAFKTPSKGVFRWIPVRAYDDLSAFCVEFLLLSSHVALLRRHTALFGLSVLENGSPEQAVRLSCCAAISTCRKIALGDARQQ